MQIEDHSSEILKSLRKTLTNRLRIAGSVVLNQAKHITPVRTGNLRNSLTLEVSESALEARVGTNVEYAAIVEFGGVITPKEAKALTVPVHPDAKRLVASGGSAADMTDLVMIARKGKAPLLVRIKSKGRNQRFDIMFVLTKSVKVKAQPYLRPALLGSKQRIMGILGANE